VHDRLRRGDRLDVAAPRGTFILRPSDAPVLLLSAGVGATPVLAMLHALAGTRSRQDIWWLHGARNRAEEPFAAESRSLLQALPGGHRYVCYSRPAPGDAAGRDYQTAGRLSASVLAALDVPRESDAYVCGPTEFMAEMSTALVDLGVDATRIRTEFFGPAPAITPGVTLTPTRPPHHPDGESTDGVRVGFARSGLTVHWDTRYASLLDLAEACDVPARWSCRTGVCHTCETSLLAGTIGYAPDPVDNPAEGNVLICCSQPVADTVLDM
jgi:ferredoxin-NADP reductase